MDLMTGGLEARAVIGMNLEARAVIGMILEARHGIGQGALGMRGIDECQKTIEIMERTMAGAMKVNIYHLFPHGLKFLCAHVH